MGFFPLVNARSLLLIILCGIRARPASAVGPDDPMCVAQLLEMPNLAARESRS